jgi:selenocysteine-specific elongation factor
MTKTDTLLEMIKAQPEGIGTDALCEALGATKQQLGDLFEALLNQEIVVSFAGYWVASEHIANIEQTVLTTLGERHLAEPSQPFQPVESFPISWSVKAKLRLGERLAQRGILTIQGKGVRLATFRATVTTKQEAFLARIIGVLEQSDVSTPYPSEIARELKVPETAITETLRLGVEVGRVVELNATTFLSDIQVGKLVGRLREAFGKRVFETREVRDLFETTRRYAGPLLDYLDTVGVTERVEGGRKLL